MRRTLPAAASVLPLRLNSIARSDVRRPMRVTARSFTSRRTLSQPRAHSGRYRKQEFVIFTSTEGVVQRRALLDGQRVGVDDRAKAAGLADLPDSVGKAVTEIDARPRRAVAAEHQAEARAAVRAADTGRSVAERPMLNGSADGSVR